VTITFDQPVSSAKATRAIGDGIGDQALKGLGQPRFHLKHGHLSVMFGSTVRPLSRAVSGTGAGAAAADSTNYYPIYCNRSYKFPAENGDGTMSWQRECGVLTAPWGFNVAPALDAICVNPMYEVGMTWHLNGFVMPRNAAHTVGCGYIIHGSLTPVGAGDNVDYWDTITFEHNLDGGGTVTIFNNGHLAFKNSGT
jgi:hypothetical protein